MIDFVVVFQAIAAGAILFRSANEKSSWDRAGFALLACSAGLMTIRRVTAGLDRYATADRVILPHVITWVMCAAATCFVLELVKRAHSASPAYKLQPSAAPNKAHMIWPFFLIFLLSASDFVPMPQPWNGEHIRDLTATEALNEALDGVNCQAACEAVRRNSARGIDVLRVIAAGEGSDAEAARLKLQALSRRIKAPAAEVDK